MVTESGSDVELTVGDLKQYSYCPRIPFYRLVQPVAHRATYSMTHGRNVQAAVESLEDRRGLRRYGLSEGKRVFGAHLRSERLRLSGKLDLLIRTPEACYPVDFKDTEGPVRENHRIQVTAYAMLVEEALKQTVPCAFVYLVPRRDVTVVHLTVGLRDTTVRLLESMREMIRRAVLPDPTPRRGRCQECELLNYCGDVL